MQVQCVLYAVPAKRKPALRRSDEPDALFATDLPLVAEEAAVMAFRDVMERRGWTVRERNGWLTLFAVIDVPFCGVPDALKGECGCCIAILNRHADDAPAEQYICAVAKAADAGKQPFERLCRQLHAEFAARLRKHEPLPGELLPCLCQAYNLLYD